MKKYWTIAVNSFQEYFSYRLNLWFEVAGGIVFILVTIWLWISITNDGVLLSGYSQAQLVTYLIGAGIITSYFFLTSQGDEINNDIHQGSLSALLVKPFNTLAYWFVRDQARKLVTALFGSIGIGLIAWHYLDHLVVPSSPVVWLLTFVAIIFGGILHFMLFSTVALLGFWTDQTWGERFFIRVISELASGMLIPLTMLPFVVKEISLALPFKFFVYVPMQIFLERYSVHAALVELSQLCAWIVICALLMRLAWVRGVKMYTAEGQ